MTHKHEWTGLWSHFGPHRFSRLRGGAHFHACFVDDCTAMFIGHGRTCEPKAHHHVEEHR